jgi:hypothetical protein
MAKPDKVTKGRKQEMVLVKCPQRPGVGTWANAASKGPRCTACSGQGHDRA